MNGHLLTKSMPEGISVVVTGSNRVVTCNAKVSKKICRFQRAPKYCEKAHFSDTVKKR